MADGVQFQPQNPYALFSPDQWSNAYSRYNNQPIPWPSSYVGWPTDAMGNPIQAPQGMTLNSSPAAAPAAPQASASPNQWAINNALINSMANNLRTGNIDGGGRGAYTGYANDPNLGNVLAARRANGPNPGQATQPAAPAASSGGGGPNLDYNSVLSLLANPGKVTTPGATVPATASAQPGPGSVGAFLQNWRPAASGPGSSFQNNFYQALKGMGY
jgi:hypothetical protein